MCSGFFMSTTDTLICEAFLQSCSRSGLDTSTLTVEVRGNVLTLKGMVPSEEQRHKLWTLLEAVDARVTDIVSHVRVVPLPREDAPRDLPAASAPATSPQAAGG